MTPHAGSLGTTGTAIGQATAPGTGSGAVTLAELLDAGLRIAGLALLAGGVALVVAFLYRWYARDRIPEGIAVLFGVAAVTVALNTESALAEAIGGRSDLLDPATAAFTLGAILASALAADAARRVGDRAALRTTDAVALRDLGEMGRVVRTRGRTLTVELPPAERIGDIDGYDPVSPETKDNLGGKSLTFPRGLTVAGLRDRLVERLGEDHGIGRVDVEFTPEGAVEYLAVGSHVAGIGATLPPGTVAVAVRADPPNAASPGDTVEVWARGTDADADAHAVDAGVGADASADPERVATAEFRAAAGDVVTLSLDEADARELDPATDYRLVTLPRVPAAEREFAALLRAADETMGAVTVAEGSPLVGVPLGALDVTVAAVRSTEGIEAIPSRSRQVGAGDTVYAVARPEAIRRFEESARAREPPGTAEGERTDGSGADDAEGGPTVPEPGDRDGDGPSTGGREG